MKHMYDIAFLSILFPHGNQFYEEKTTRYRSQNITAIQKEIMKGFKQVNEGDFRLINTLLVPFIIMATRSQLFAKEKYI